MFDFNQNYKCTLDLGASPAAVPLAASTTRLPIMAGFRLHRSLVNPMM